MFLKMLAMTKLFPSYVILRLFKKKTRQNSTYFSCLFLPFITTKPEKNRPKDKIIQLTIVFLFIKNLNILLLH